MVYLGAYESMLKHIEKHYTLSLDYSYDKNKTSTIEDSGTLLDLIFKEEEKPIFSEEQVHLAIKAIRLCSLTNGQKRALKYFLANGKKEYINSEGKRLPTQIASAIQKIKHRVRALRRVYGEPG